MFGNFKTLKKSVFILGGGAAIATSNIALAEETLKREHVYETSAPYNKWTS